MATVPHSSPTGKPLSAVVYTRVSTDAQERDGTSLDTQERACMEYARANGWQVLECIRDAASGFSLDRPGVERLRRLLRDGSVGVVIAYAVDRVSRNQNQIGVIFDEIQSAEAKLEFVTEKFEDTAVGRFILAARAFIAEVEREKIVERTTRGKTERARSGKIPQATGKGCYGYIYDARSGHRELHPEQALVVRDLFLSFVQGNSLISIANRLNDASTPAFAGGLWHTATLFHMLRNPVYSGRTTYRRTVAHKVRDPQTGKKKRVVELRDAAEWIDVAGATPAIVEEATFVAAQAILDDPERLRMGRRINDYALSGRLRCRRCGHAMVGQTLRKRFRYYRCRRAFAGPHHDRCDALYVRADDLEDAVRQEVARVLADPALIVVEYRRLRGTSDDANQHGDLQRQLDSLDGQKRRLVKLYQLGEVDDAYFAAESQTLRTKRKAIEDRLASVRTPAQPELSWDGLEKACQLVEEWVKHAEPSDVALLAEALQLRLTVEPGIGEMTGVIPRSEQYTRMGSHADVRPVVR